MSSLSVRSSARPSSCCTHHFWSTPFSQRLFSSACFPLFKRFIPSGRCVSFVSDFLSFLLCRSRSFLLLCFHFPLSSLIFKHFSNSLLVYDIPFFFRSAQVRSTEPAPTMICTQACMNLCMNLSLSSLFFLSPLSFFSLTPLTFLFLSLPSPLSLSLSLFLSPFLFLLHRHVPLLFSFLFFRH